MNKRFLIGIGVVAAVVVIVLVPFGTPLVAVAGKKIRERMARAEAIRVATREDAFRKAPVC